MGGCLLLHITNKIGTLFAYSRPPRSVKILTFVTPPLLLPFSFSFSLSFCFCFYLYIHALGCIFMLSTKVVIIVKILTFLCNKFTLICEIWLKYALFCILLH
nr:MAG TPA: hypothetical protein [Caudoviricetes sp.]